MKNIILTLVLVFSFSPMAQAGLIDRIASIKVEDFDIGALGGANQSLMDNASSIESVNLSVTTSAEDEIGFHVGGRIRYNFSDAFKIGFDVTWSRHRIQIKETSVGIGSPQDEYNINMDFVNLRPHLSYVTNFGISLSAGMSFGFSANAEVERINTLSGLKTTTDTIFDDPQSRTAAFGSIGYEWEVMGHILIPEVGFELALTDAFATTDVLKLSQNVDARSALTKTRINSAYAQIVLIF